MTGLHIFLIVLAALALLFLVFCVVLLCVALLRTKTPEMDPSDLARLRENADFVRDGVAWFKAQPLETVEITSFDGLRLSGYFLPAENARCTAILMHGYRSDLLWDFAGAYQLLHEHGCSLLVPYQRAQGQSQGRFLCMGVKEKRDCADWARYIERRLGPDMPIILEGMSMGATTVLLAAGEALPASVRGIVADCGYTSPWEEFAHVMRTRMHLPVRPVLDVVSLLSRLTAGFGFRDCSTVDALQRSALPLLLLHGEADNFVPPRFSRENFAASASPDKELILVPGAAHACSYLVDMARCKKAILDFYDRCTAPERGGQTDGVQGM